MRRVQQDGVGDVQIGLHNPELRTSLFSSTEPTSKKIRLVRALAFFYPQWGDRLMKVLLRLGGHTWTENI